MQQIFQYLKSFLKNMMECRLCIFLLKLSSRNMFQNELCLSDLSSVVLFTLKSLKQFITLHYELSPVVFFLWWLHWSLLNLIWGQRCLELYYIILSHHPLRTQLLTTEYDMLYKNHPLRILIFAVSFRNTFPRSSLLSLLNIRDRFPHLLSLIQWNFKGILCINPFKHFNNSNTIEFFLFYLHLTDLSIIITLA